MRNYLILKERAAAFRADPAVQEALRASRLDELARPTADDGLKALLADRSRLRGLRRRAPPPNAAWPSKPSTSSPWNTSSASADPTPGLPDGHTTTAGQPGNVPP